MHRRVDARAAARRDGAAAGVLYLAAAGLYLATELATAIAFSPPYEYARNYISDLGVPACGAVYDGRAICSPLHGLMNAGFALQGVLFIAAALVMVRSAAHPARYAFLACAGLNGVGNVLIAIFPETAAASLGALRLHVLGAILAIVFGNATAFASIWTIRERAWPRLHVWTSILLPLLAALALACLAHAPGFGAAQRLPDAVWERLSVYAITGWEFVTGVCVIAAWRRMHP